MLSDINSVLAWMESERVKVAEWIANEDYMALGEYLGREVMV
jgi:hypothetical protein